MTRPGFGKIAEGLSGIVTLTGEAGQAPLFVGFSLADASAGLFGIYAVAAALYRRDVMGGGGARIDLALFEPLMRMLDCQMAVHDMTGKPPERSGSNDPYGFGLADPDRPALAAAMSASGDWYLFIPSAVELRLDGLPNAELEAALRQAGVEFAPVFDGMTIARSPYFQARGEVVTMEHPLLGRISAAGRLSGPSERAPFRAPGLGEDNVAVFTRDLGLDQAEIDRLTAEGAI
jgi:crotonobetainyl-CoA:carnitine CoA-transferase CaiB-like acyl-CoA transferase